MLTIQILLVLFFAYAITRVVARARHGELTAGPAIGWVLVWVTGAFVVVSPGSTTLLAHLVGVGRGVDLVMYVALSLVFFMLFWLMLRLEKLNREITRLTREAALRNADDAKK